MHRAANERTRDVVAPFRSSSLNNVVRIIREHSSLWNPMKSIYVRMTETTKKGTKNNEETRETRDERRESSTIVCHDGLTRCSVLHCMLTTANGITEFAAVNTILLLLFVRKLSHVFSLSIRIVHVFSCANSRKKNYEKKTIQNQRSTAHAK